MTLCELSSVTLGTGCPLVTQLLPAQARDSLQGTPAVPQPAVLLPAPGTAGGQQPCRAWGGTARLPPCWAQALVGAQPLAQSSGLQSCPSSLSLSANTGSGGARSKWGSGDTGGKHGLWSVCCLGKGWKINLLSAAVLCTCSFLLYPPHFILGRGRSALAVWRRWERDFLGRSGCFPRFPGLGRGCVLR